MNKPANLDDPHFAWGNDVWCATRRGDVGRLIVALRSDRPLGPESERMVREAVAALLAGEFKRKRGAPKRRPTAIDDAEDFVRTIKTLVRASGKSPRFIEKAAIEEAVRRYDISEEVAELRAGGKSPRFVEKFIRRYGVSELALTNRLHRARKK